MSKFLHLNSSDEVLDKNFTYPNNITEYYEFFDEIGFGHGRNRRYRHLELPGVVTNNPKNQANQDTVEESNALYFYMLSQRMKELGLEIRQTDSPIVTQPKYRNARTIRTLANQFMKTEQRTWVFEQAENVDLDSLNFLTFQQLLNGLFEEVNVTWEKVLVLFYFCTDLSIRAFDETNINSFANIYNWTIVFLSGKFSLWIDAEGGWNAVLNNSINFVQKATLLTICCVVLTATYMYIKRK